MADDLVKRLREAADDEHDWAVDQDFWHEEILREAADRIEELERDEAYNAAWRNGIAQEAAEAKVEQLEREAILDAKLLADTQALLDKAVAALRAFDKAAADVSKLAAVTGSQWSQLVSAGLKARAVLTEIEGKKHE